MAAGIEIREGRNGCVVHALREKRRSRKRTERAPKTRLERPEIEATTCAIPNRATTTAGAERLERIAVSVARVVFAE